LLEEEFTCVLPVSTKAEVSNSLDNGLHIGRTVALINGWTLRNDLLVILCDLPMPSSQYRLLRINIIGSFAV